MGRIGLLMLGLGLAGCATMPAPQAPAPQPAPGAPLSAVAPPPPPEATTPEALDTTSVEQREAAKRPPAAPEDQLGRAVASLGDPADPGFWAATSFVTQPQPGRLVDPTTGFSVLVELRPRSAEGSGVMVSLPALRALGVPLTSLREVVVYAAAP